MSTQKTRKTPALTAKEFERLASAARGRLVKAFNALREDKPGALSIARKAYKQSAAELRAMNAHLKHVRGE